MNDRIQALIERQATWIEQNGWPNSYDSYSEALRRYEAGELA
jgi:hypothetical protein